MTRVVRSLPVLAMSLLLTVTSCGTQMTKNRMQQGLKTEIQSNDFLLVKNSGGHERGIITSNISPKSTIKSGLYQEHGDNHVSKDLQTNTYSKLIEIKEDTTTLEKQVLYHNVVSDDTTHIVLQVDSKKNSGSLKIEKSNTGAHKDVGMFAGAAGAFLGATIASPRDFSRAAPGILLISLLGGCMGRNFGKLRPMSVNKTGVTACVGGIFAGLLVSGKFMNNVQKK